MSLTPLDEVALLGAGVLAGTVGTAGGITSLVSYPALLAVGIAPLAANVANMVAVVASWPGSAVVSGPELRGSGARLAKMAVAACAGGAGGAALLLATPAGVFAGVVPFLVLGASLGLLAQPRITARQGPRLARASRSVLPATLFAVSLYNGYFGAGAGIMVLTTLLLLVEADLAKANAFKNMLVGASTAVSALIFTLFAHVDWGAVAPLAVGVFIGGTIGPRIARRVSANLLRRLVALVGIGLALWLWINAA